MLRLVDMNAFGMGYFADEPSWNASALDRKGSDSMTWKFSSMSRTSTLFHTNVLTKPTLDITCADGFVIHTHKDVLLAASDNLFGSFLEEKLVQAIPLPRPAKELLVKAISLPATKALLVQAISVPSTRADIQILLAAVYGIRTKAPSSIEALVQAIDLLPQYGLQPQSCIRPTTSLYDTLLAHIPASAFVIFALASRHNLEDLAVEASARLLDFQVMEMSDEMVDLVRPKFFLRLYALQSERVAALKGIIFEYLQPQLSTTLCSTGRGGAACEDMYTEWALAVSDLTWNSDPSISSASIRMKLSACSRSLNCRPCKAITKKRVNAIIFKWNVVKATI